MIGGFEMFGQSSTLSGTPSASASSCTVPQVPLFVTLVLMQVCGAMPTQVPWAPVQSDCVTHTMDVLTLQWPAGGQVPAPAPVQKTSLVRLQVPLVSVVVVGLPQSPSQASPMWSPSVSLWDGLKVRTQLSCLSGKLSPSMSVFPLHARPWAAPPGPGTCAGL